MKRPAGLVFASVLLILISVKQLAISALIAFAGTVAPHQAASNAQSPPPPWIATFMFAAAGFCVLLAAWGIATAIGLLRVRSWARYSVLIIGGCLAFFGLSSVVGSTLLFMLPLPLPPSADPAQVHTIQSIVRIFLGILIAYDLVLGAIGVWWLVYFSRPRMRELFAHGVPQQYANERPIPIAILAVLNMFGAVICLVYAFVPFPAFAFGVALHGAGKALLYLVFCVATGMAGWGLWTRKEWGRRLALGLLAAGTLNTLACIVRPSALSAYTIEVNRRFAIETAALPPNYQSTIMVVSFAFGILVMAGIAWVLIRYRASFVRPDSSVA